MHSAPHSKWRNVLVSLCFFVDWFTDKGILRNDFSKQLLQYCIFILGAELFFVILFWRLFLKNQCDYSYLLLHFCNKQCD